MSDATRARFGFLAVGAIALLRSAGAFASDPGTSANPPKAEAARHSVVPGFERIQGDGKADAVQGGLVLLGELNCTACHQTNQSLDSWLARKQAPVLDHVGGRVRPGYIRAFLDDPQAVKPGTTMPAMLSGLPRKQRAEAAEALTHFLASTGRATEKRVDRKLVANGKLLYHQIGCVACHGPRDTKDTNPVTTVPLGDLAAQYTMQSLTAFLRDPHQSRPSGRMPAFLLEGPQAHEIASYLLENLSADVAPNLAFRYYEGQWARLPDFNTLKPVLEGTAEGFDLSRGKRLNEVAFRFEGNLKIARAGDYTFLLRSDDGSKLFIDDAVVVDNDGIHAPAEKTNRATLKKGAHKLVVGAFNGGGGFELDAEIEGPGLPRQPIANLVSIADERPRRPVTKRFQVDPALAEKGRALFSSMGCASCHQLKQGDRPTATKLEAKPLAALSVEGGCLATTHSGGVPEFSLGERQRKSLTAALQAIGSLSEKTSPPRETIARTLAAFNCYACHARDGKGGVEERLNAFFETTQKEMGDEGRIPPHLDGVGAKLTEVCLKHVFADGSKERPYMHTRMPKFGEQNLAALLKAVRELDRIDPVPVPRFDESTKKVKTHGRFLAGSEAFGCIKCHTFKGVPAEGVQAIDMARMTARLNRDWFHRYVVDPAKFRPGTRMPTAWPGGQALLPLYDRSAVKQVEAVWQFLSDGGTAAEPVGLGRGPMPLVADKEAIVYRNFIQGGGPRSIGVGYPEKANLVFDANDMRLALIWQGAFLDASRHWTGRGEGYQAPLGDNVLSLPPGPPFATLPSPSHPWPNEPSKRLGYKFQGYRLSKDQRPTFLFAFKGTKVEERPDAVAPVGTDGSPGLKQTFLLTAEPPPKDLWFRALVADRIEPQKDGAFLVNGEWKLRVDSGSAAIVRTSEGKAELLAPVKFSGGRSKVVEQFDW